MLGPLTIITGTDTDVGKTITTAALAATLQLRGRRVAVYKPVQTGSSTPQDGDMAVVRRLSGVATVSDGIRLPDPMAPRPAARRAGIRLPALRDHVAAIHQADAEADHVLVEGAGGLLVELTDRADTLLELAHALERPVSVIVVARAGLGTLNHTALTLRVLAQAALPVAGVVIGSWPRTATSIEYDNAAAFAAQSPGLLARIPAGAGALPPPEFQQRAPTWFAPVAAESA